MFNKRKIAMLCANSPDELKTLLKVHGASLRSAPGIVLALGDPSVLICPFQFEEIKLNEVADRIRFEMLEVMPIPLDQIVFDYQITENDGNNVKGVYVGIPKDVFAQYLSLFEKANLVPSLITAGALANFNAFYGKVRPQHERFAFVDFSVPNQGFLIVMSQKGCELMRHIPTEHADEALSETKQSLRSVCCKSTLKTCEEIFYLGKESISAGLKELAAVLGARFTVLNDETLEISHLGAADVFRVNLAANHFFNLNQRRGIDIILQGVLSICLLATFTLGFLTLRDYGELKGAKASLSDKDVSYASSLVEQINQLEQ